MENSRRPLIDVLVPRAPGDPLVMLRLAELLRAEGEELQAVDWCARALALASGDLAMVSRCRAFLSRRVPTWHFPMLADEGRTQALCAVPWPRGLIRRRPMPRSRNGGPSSPSD